MKTYVITWQENTNKTVYLDQQNTERGTTNIDNAMSFASEDSAQEFIDENCGPHCSVYEHEYELSVEHITVSLKQEGYGRQGLYVNGTYIMSVFPNFDEHFNICHIDDAFVFQDEDGNLTDENGNESDTEVYHDGSGRALDGIYTSKEEYVIDHLLNEVEQALMSE